MSLETWLSMTYTVCRAPIQMTSYIYNHIIIDVKVASSRRHSAKGLSKTFDNSVIAMVTDR